MSFNVYIVRYHQEAELVKKRTTCKQAARLMGSYIRGNKRTPDLQECYAIGNRFGYRYSQSELINLSKPTKVP